MSKASERGRQGLLFGEIEWRSREHRPRREKRPAPAKGGTRWRMPEPAGGSTVALVRLLWMKRLTPAQISQVEAEIAALPRLLTNLGFGTVVLVRSWVRRKRS